MLCVPPEDNVILSLCMYSLWNELVSLLKRFIFSYCNSADDFSITKPPEHKKIKVKHIFRGILLFSHH